MKVRDILAAINEQGSQQLAVYLIRRDLPFEYIPRRTVEKHLRALAETEDVDPLYRIVFPPADNKRWIIPEAFEISILESCHPGSAADEARLILSTGDCEDPETLEPLLEKLRRSLPDSIGLSFLDDTEFMNSEVDRTSLPSDSAAELFKLLYRAREADLDSDDWSFSVRRHRLLINADTDQFDQAGYVGTLRRAIAYYLWVADTLIRMNDL